MTDGSTLANEQLMEVVNKLGKVLDEAGDGQSAAVALGLFLGVTVARQGGDLDEAMDWLRKVAAWGMDMMADGRIDYVVEARAN